MEAEGDVPVGVDVHEMVEQDALAQNESEVEVSPEIQVEVVHDEERKPFCGGYRSRKTMLEYHNASTQTARKKKEVSTKEKYHRDTQTKSWNTRSTQTYREQGTQTIKPGLFLDTRSDRVLRPKTYFDSEQWLKLQVEKAIVVQSFVRGCFARMRTDALRCELEEKSEAKYREHQERLQKDEEERRKEIERRMHPRTAEDFRVLYSELEAWRLQETAKVKSSNLSKDDQHLALQELLKKETKLLQTIDRLKIAAAKENRQNRVNKKVETMSSDKQLQTQKGETISVETPFSVRAKELADLYAGLQLPHLSVDERLDVLLHVKWSVKEFDCALTREIVELIDREADMLNRGRPPKSLEGIRIRINNLFLQFMETPEFNPESLRHMKVNPDFLVQPEVQPLKKKR